MFMTKTMRKGYVFLALCLMVALIGPAFAARTLTVGEFVQELAKFRNLEATSVDAAAASLTRAGIRVPDGLDYSSPLTEGTVSRISRAAGVEVRTSNPDAPFTDDQVDIFLMSFSDQFGESAEDNDNSTRNGETPGGSSGSAPGNGPPFDPYSKGKGGSKGKKKGHASPTEPE
jgi:hypothetical protein